MVLCALYRSFKPALNSKGLRRSRDFKRLSAAVGFKPALNSKGLRPLLYRACRREVLLQASPEFKGIKTRQTHKCRHPRWLQASPEFKGIKTMRVGRCCKTGLLQASPEFKGIKTGCGVVCVAHMRFKPALNSKGLRPWYPGVPRVTGTASSQP